MKNSEAKSLRPAAKNKSISQAGGLISLYKSRRFPSQWSCFKFLFVLAGKPLHPTILALCVVLPMIPG